MTKDARRERYEQLRKITEAEDAEYDDKLYTEQCQLFYELNPEDFKGIGARKGEKPRDIWGVDTSCYDK